MSYQQKFRLDGERAVVTGGGRAIGLCCSEALAEAGAVVVVIERNEADAEQALALRDKGYDVEVRVGDVTDAARMDAIATELADGGRPATILVNNAGIGQSGIPAEELTDADWLRMMAVPMMPPWLISFADSASPASAISGSNWRSPRRRAGAASVAASQLLKGSR